ncbi:MAG: hypothetical protein ACKPBU_00170, partial [Alphaproteobacteria bacterium]
MRMASKTESSRMAEERFRRLELPDEVAGALYLHRMPGRNERIEDTWAAIEAGGIACIVCLTSEAEIAKKSPSYARAVKDGTVPCERIEFPIKDRCVPRDETELMALARRIVAKLRSGDGVLMHCAAGVGRTGMVARCVL